MGITIWLLFQKRNGNSFYCFGYTEVFKKNCDLPCLFTNSISPVEIFCMNERQAVEITFFVFIRIIRSLGILSYICISEKDSL